MGGLERKKKTMTEQHDSRRAVHTLLAQVAPTYKVDFNVDEFDFAPLPTAADLMGMCFVEKHASAVPALLAYLETKVAYHLATGFGAAARDDMYARSSACFEQFASEISGLTMNEQDRLCSVAYHGVDNWCWDNIPGRS